MRDIDELIAEFCDKKLPPDPGWSAILRRSCGQIGVNLGLIGSERKEIEDHLRDSFSHHLAQGNSAERAWELVREHFGDPAIVLNELRALRTQSRRCLLIRLPATVVLLTVVLSNHAIFSWLINAKALVCLGVGISAGILFFRDRAAGALRKYGLWGAWFGLMMGFVWAIATQRVEDAGYPVLMMLSSTFYGLILASHHMRGPGQATMVILCQVGIAFPLSRFGLLPFFPQTFHVPLLKLAASASLIALIAGLAIFDFRKLHRRLAGAAAIGMCVCYCQILQNLTNNLCTILELEVITLIPFLVAGLVALPIRHLQESVLRETA
jgi:hypothetical protein